MENYYVNKFLAGKFVGYDFFAGQNKINYGTLVSLLERKAQAGELDTVTVNQFDKSGNMLELVVGLSFSNERKFAERIEPAAAELLNALTKEVV